MKKILFTAFSIFFISVMAFAQFRIDTPEPVAPDDASIDHMPDVILDWTAILNATGYHIMVSTDENFNNVIVDELIPLSAFQNEYLMFNSTYYWKVRAAEGEDFSGWSETRNFTTFAMLELDSPDDDGEEAEVEFKWEKEPFEATNELSGFDKYQLQVDLDSTALNSNPEWNIMFDYVEGTNKHTVDYVYYGDTMYWRMRAIHPFDTCEWSNVLAFVTDGQIELDKPEDGITDTDLEFDIEWGEFAGTIEYEYQVHVNESFNGALTYFLDSTEVPVPVVKYGTEYFWRVRGKNTIDTTDWSEVWTFSTAGQVMHVAPVNMAASVELNPQLEWDPILGSNFYAVQFDTDSTFNNTETLITPGTFFNNPNPLNYGTNYYWRIRAYAEHDTSSYSDAWWFKTAEQVLHLAPLNMADSVELQPKLDWDPILGSNSYDLQYSTDSTFDGAETINLTDHFFNIGTALDEGTKYFWRVRACAAHDTSNYSDPWSFTTMPSIGIDEYFNNDQLSIFPNPATDFATINITARKDGEVIYTITDLTGKELLTGQLNLMAGENAKQLNLRGMAKGIYLVNLGIDDSMITRKLIIK